MLILETTLEVFNLTPLNLVNETISNFISCLQYSRKRKVDTRQFGCKVEVEARTQIQNLMLLFKLQSLSRSGKFKKLQLLGSEIRIQIIFIYFHRAFDLLFQGIFQALNFISVNLKHQKKYAYGI